ncbi:MAG TPA: sugar transferase [Anaerolineae bacterium]|nr:sugar transferase [Anaerolineae bacterium]
MKAHVERVSIGARQGVLSFSFADRRLLLLALDLVGVNMALLLSLALRPTFTFDVSLVLRRPLWFFLLSAFWILWAYAFDAYDLRVVGRWIASASAALKAAALTAGLYLLLPYVTPPLPARRSLLLVFPFLLVTFVEAGRGLHGLLLRQPAFRRRTLILGAGWSGRTVARALAEDGNGAYEIVGFVDDDPAKRGTMIPLAEGDNPPASPTSSACLFRVVGDRHALDQLIIQHQVDTLILAITHDIDGDLMQRLLDCLELGVEIIPMPVLYEQLTGRVPVEHVGGNWYVAMPIMHPLTRPLNRAVKRLMDIVLASLGLLFLVPFLPIIALAIYLDSPGPVFYTQTRVGRSGRLFKAYKFRSMVPDAERGRAVWAREGDPRVTRVGRFLRKTHIDEFPQFLNVLKGEMSAVGPRPERPEFVEELVREIPFYRVRHAVKPGMAGWALVKYGYASSKEDAVMKLQYDLYYIKHWSPWLDLVILLKTVIDTLTLRGRA